MTAHLDVLDLVSQMRAQDERFAIATVVRTVSVTAAKAGAKAIIRDDGSIVAGWIGGGCARGAVLKAAREALADGAPRMISVQPQDLLSSLGVEAGETRDGIRFSKNMCPSQGTMDIFIEPVLPKPELVILGASPVALALAQLARQFGYRTILAAPAQDRPVIADADVLIDGFTIPELSTSQRFVVISTQGKGDEAALRAAITIDAEYRAFVGSRRKITSIRQKLAPQIDDTGRLENIKAPAGLDIGAITPDEIALSILSEMTAVRRRLQRGGIM